MNNLVDGESEEKGLELFILMNEDFFAGTNSSNRIKMSGGIS